MRSAALPLFAAIVTGFLGGMMGYALTQDGLASPHNMTGVLGFMGVGGFCFFTALVLVAYWTRDKK